MKNLILTLLLIPMVALAQTPESDQPQIIQVPPEVLEQMQRTQMMQEFTYTTVLQFICVVIYERAGNQEKVDVYMKAPGVHARQHEIPDEVTLPLLQETLTMIRAEFDENITANGKVEKMTEMCEQNYETVKRYIAPPVQQAPVIEGQTI